MPTIKTVWAALLVSTAMLAGCDGATVGKFSGKEKEAKALYSRVAGADQSAMMELIKKSDDGNVYASLQAGYILHTGTGGVTPDYLKAAEFYDRAGKMPLANYNYALLLINKQVPAVGTENPVTAAIARLQLAAERANSDFVLPWITLAQIYEKGIGGIPKNAEVAVSWYEKAASHGDPYAMFMLGNAYLNGVGRPLNPYLAEKWLNNAADRWNADAQLTLGMMMTKQDYKGYNPVAAAKWFYIASLSRPEFVSFKDKYFAGLSEQQRNNVLRIADSWMKGHQVIPVAPPYNRPSNGVRGTL